MCRCCQQWCLRVSKLSRVQSQLLISHHKKSPASKTNSYSFSNPEVFLSDIDARSKTCLPSTLLFNLFFSSSIFTVEWVLVLTQRGFVAYQLLSNWGLSWLLPFHFIITWKKFFSWWPFYKNYFRWDIFLVLEGLRVGDRYLQLRALPEDDHSSATPRSQPNLFPDNLNQKVESFCAKAAKISLTALRQFSTKSSWRDFLLWILRGLLESLEYSGNFDGAPSQLERTQLAIQSWHLLRTFSLISQRCTFDMMGQGSVSRL